MTGTALFDMATDALREAVREVIEERRREGRPIAIWRDGRAIWVDPNTNQEVLPRGHVAEERETYSAES